MIVKISQFPKQDKFSVISEQIDFEIRRTVVEIKGTGGQADWQTDITVFAVTYPSRTQTHHVNVLYVGFSDHLNTVLW